MFSTVGEARVVERAVGVGHVDAASEELVGEPPGGVVSAPDLEHEVARLTPLVGLAGHHRRLGGRAHGRTSMSS